MRRAMRRARLGDVWTDMGLPANFVLPGMPYTDPTTADPSKGTDVLMPDGTYRHFDAQYDSAGNPVSPKIFITDSLPGGYAVAMPGTEEYQHYENVMQRDTNQGLIKVAALVGGAAAAGAFFGGAAPATEGVETATHVATASDAAYGAVQTAEALQPIVVTAQPIIASADALATGLVTGAGAGAAAAADVMVVTAPAVAGGAAVTAGAATGATLLSFPALAGSEASVNALTDELVKSVNTPQMQEAIAAGDVPPPPASVLSSSFTKWGVSTGISALEKQLGRALSPQEQASVEQQMATEIQRLQAQLAAQGAPNASLPNSALDQNTVASMLDQISSNKNLQLAILAGAALVAITAFS